MTSARSPESVDLPQLPEAVAPLVAIKAVDAIYAERDEEGVLHIFVVVGEHKDAVYDKLLLVEKNLAKQLDPDAMMLHIRAHQGREVRFAVPFSSEPLYKR